MNDVSASYKGIEIELRPIKLQQGGWMADFTLSEDIGSEKTVMPYDGKMSFPTRETAKAAALDSARTIIDEKC
jgi:hypothetical protein